MFWHCCCNVVVPEDCETEQHNGAWGTYASTDESYVVIYPQGGQDGVLIRRQSPSSGTLDNFDTLLVLENVQVTQGTVVNSALLRIIGTNPGFNVSGTLCVDITAWESDHTANACPAAPCNPSGWNTSDVLALDTTEASVEFCHVVPNSLGPPVNFVIPPIEIAPVLNEIFARPGWTSGNNILLLFKTNSNTTYSIGNFLSITIDFDPILPEVLITYPC